MEYLGGGSALDLVCMIILDCYVVFRDGWEITKFKWHYTMFRKR